MPATSRGTERVKRTTGRNVVGITIEIERYRIYKSLGSETEGTPPA